MLQATGDQQESNIQKMIFATSYANQENINKYCHSDQHHTFLDIDYDSFPTLEIPEVLKAVSAPILTTSLPSTNVPEIIPHLPTLAYNFYNLDPNWRTDILANRILLLEPSVFAKYPVSARSIEFCLPRLSTVL